MSFNVAVIFPKTNEIVPSAIGSQFLWFNSQIKVDKHVIFCKEFSEKNLNFFKTAF